MFSTVLSACLSLLLLPSASGASAPGTPASRAMSQKKGAKVEEYQPFRGTLAEARTMARERNVPLLVCMTLEGEDESDNYDAAILADAGFRQRATGTVILVSNNVPHATRKLTQVIDGEKVTREVCSRYPEGSCEDHMRTWDELYFAYAVKGELRLPETIVIDVNLKPGVDSANNQVTWRFSTGGLPSVSEITGAVGILGKKLGQGLTRAEHAALAAHLARGRIMTKARSWPDAWRAWLAILAVTKDGPFAAEAAAEAPLAEAGLRAEIAALQERLQPGEINIPYGRLLELEQECADLPIAKDLNAQLRKVRRRKDIRDDIERFELEREAEKLWSEAVDFATQGEARKAERVAKKLLKKKYAGTPAYERARQRWPELAD